MFFCVVDFRPINIQRVFFSQDCDNAPEYEIGIFSNIQKCVNECLRRFENIRYVKYGKNLKKNQCFCEKSKNCGTPRVQENNFDIYKIFFGKRSNNSDQNTTSLKVSRVFNSRDCNDAPEHSIGSFSTVQECATECEKRIKIIRISYVKYGKNLYKNQCFCEESPNCGNRIRNENFDIYNVRRVSSMIPA